MVNHIPTIIPGPWIVAITAVFPGCIAMKSLFPPVVSPLEICISRALLQLRQQRRREEIVERLCASSPLVATAGQREGR